MIIIIGKICILFISIFFSNYFVYGVKKMLNFVICDDNVNILNKLSYMLDKIFIKHDLSAHVTYKTTDSNELLSFSNNNSIDVLILDIQLKSNTNGIDIANKIRETNKDVYIIFTTAHSEYVFLAYKCKTFDFLCKPITLERLEETILRLFSDINGTKNKKKYLKLDNKNTFIDENEIQYIKRSGMKLIIHTSTRDYEIYSSFSKLQNNLPKNFIRCHKSFIANINNISKFDSTLNLIHFEKSTCDIGPKYKNEFMKGVEIYGNIK